MKRWALLTVLLLPFLAVAWLLADRLLGAHDINHYLEAQPPEFLLAVVLSTVLALIVVGLLAYALLRLLFSLPNVLLERLSVWAALRRSLWQTRGRTLWIAACLFAWLSSCFLIFTLANFVIQRLKIRTWLFAQDFSECPLKRPLGGRQGAHRLLGRLKSKAVYNH